jgi:hypothetical protein
MRPAAFRLKTMRLLWLVAGLFMTMEAHAGQCSARSGERTAALVELYTSEGCSSCPPADRWLSGLGRTYGPERVVPLALHVDYWDYIGWKDPYAKRAFSQRQRRLSALQRQALVYTPQVLLQGVDFRGWMGGDFERTVARINAQPARARLELDAAPSEGKLRVSVLAQAIDPKAGEGAVVYVASYENRLQNRVDAGENSGRVLSHDHVALEWQGPFPLGSRELTLPLLPKARLADSGVVAFVQNPRTAEVLQALMLPACAVPAGPKPN